MSSIQRTKILLLIIALSLFSAKAQTGEVKKLKASGFIQTQFQYGEKDALLNVGAENKDKEEPFNRIGIRRGRIKLSYEENIASGVFQLDVTEKGLGFKDAYFNLKNPWWKTNALRAGVFGQPFGYELAYSSSQRESLEMSKVLRTLFPDERDLGIMLMLQASENSPWNFIKFQAGLFAGNGIKQEVDNRKDFITQLILSQYLGMNVKARVGFSYYNGGVYQATDSVYKMQNRAFTLSNEGNKGKFAKREYFGFDAHVALLSRFGTTEIRSEYLFGTQPGTASSTKSPTGGLPSGQTYIRNFSGGYLMLVQNIGEFPVGLVAKYDWYDPNTKVSGNELGLNYIQKVDARQTTWGFGAFWDIIKSVRLQAYYEIVDFEKSDNLLVLSDIKSDVFTLRLQYQF